MSEALFLFGPRDARIAPFNLRDGKPRVSPSRSGCGRPLRQRPPLLQGRRHRRRHRRPRSCLATSSAAIFATTPPALGACAGRFGGGRSQHRLRPLRLVSGGLLQSLSERRVFRLPSPFDGAMTFPDLGSDVADRPPAASADAARRRDAGAVGRGDARCRSRQAAAAGDGDRARRRSQSDCSSCKC